MLYDIWLDDDGDLHILPSGSYRIYSSHKPKFQVTLFLNEHCAPDEVAMVRVTKGKICHPGLDLGAALSILYNYEKGKL